MAVRLALVLSLARGALAAPVRNVNGSHVNALQTTTTTQPDCTTSAGYTDYITDEKGDLSIPTCFGATATGKCSCQTGTVASTHTSLLAGSTAATSQQCMSADTSGDVFYMSDACNMGASTYATPAALTMITTCLTPDRTDANLPTATMFVLGDSHMGATAPGLVYAVRGHYQVRHLRTNTYGIFPHSIEAVCGNDCTTDAQYVTIYNQILSTLSSVMQQGDVVALASWSAGWGMTPLVGTGVESTTQTTMDMMKETMLDAVITPAGGSLVIFGDWPYFESNGVAGQPPSGTPAAADVRVQMELKPQAEALAAANTNVHYVSLVGLFCESDLDSLTTGATEMAAGQCSYNIPGTTINGYANQEHLNTVGSIYMWPFICDELTTAGLI